MRLGGPSDPRQRLGLHGSSPGSLGPGLARSIIAVLFFSWRWVGELSPLLNLFPVHLTGFYYKLSGSLVVVDLGAVIGLTWLHCADCEVFLEEKNMF
jgi:hypothetical protein